MSDNVIIKTYRPNMNNWLPFGKFVINKNSLYKKNSLNVKYKKNLCKLRTGTTFANVKHISDAFVDFISNITTECDHFDMNMFFELSDAEQRLAIELLETSNYDNEIGFNWTEAYRNRFKVLQGELSVGNTNKEIVREAMKVVEKLIRLHVITKKDGTEMLQELRQSEINDFLN